MYFPECFIYLFPWIWQNLLLSMAMFVQKMDSSWDKAIRVHNIFFRIYTPQLQDPLSYFSALNPIRMEARNIGELQVLHIIAGVLVKWGPEIVPRAACLL